MQIITALSRHPEGLTARQIQALTRFSESYVYGVLRQLRKEGRIKTEIAWDLPRNPAMFMLQKKGK